MKSDFQAPDIRFSYDPRKGTDIASCGLCSEHKVLRNEQDNDLLRVTAEYDYELSPKISCVIADFSWFAGWIRIFKCSFVP